NCRGIGWACVHCHVSTQCQRTVIIYTSPPQKWAKDLHGPRISFGGRAARELSPGVPCYQNRSDGGIEMRVILNMRRENQQYIHGSSPKEQRRLAGLNELLNQAYAATAQGDWYVNNWGMPSQGWICPSAPERSTNQWVKPAIVSPPDVYAGSVDAAWVFGQGGENGWWFWWDLD